jgi:hypothetical protein
MCLQVMCVRISVCVKVCANKISVCPLRVFDVPATRALVADGKGSLCK